MKNIANMFKISEIWLLTVNYLIISLDLANCAHKLDLNGEQWMLKDNSGSKYLFLYFPFYYY